MKICYYYLFHNQTCQYLLHGFCIAQQLCIKQNAVTSTLPYKFNGETIDAGNQNQKKNYRVHEKVRLALYVELSG